MKPLELTEAKSLEEKGNLDGALAIIFDRLDQAFTSGMFEEADQWLKEIRHQSLSPDLLVGILAASLPAKDKLPSRSHLWRRAKETLANEKHLLTGLE